MIPNNDDALLTRDALANALTALGFPIAGPTLASKATRGGGPPFQRFGRRPLYRWGDAVAWARARLEAPVKSTSEPRPSFSESLRHDFLCAHHSRFIQHSQPAYRVDPREHDRGGTNRRAPGDGAEGSFVTTPATLSASHGLSGKKAKATCGEALEDQPCRPGLRPYPKHKGRRLKYDLHGASVVGLAENLPPPHEAPIGTTERPRPAPRMERGIRQTDRVCAPWLQSPCQATHISPVTGEVCPAFRSPIAIH
jgi:hypothetical protein